VNKQRRTKAFSHIHIPGLAGAPVSSIITLLSKEFVNLPLIAGITMTGMPLLATSVRTIRAAAANPAERLVGRSRTNGSQT
jgi:hypothetical protein